MTFAADKAAIEARAETILGQANSYLADLIAQASPTIIEGTTVLPEYYNYATVPQINFPVFSATRPIITTAGVELPPTAPETEFSTITDVSIPTFDTAAPTLNFPTAPSATLPDAPGSAPAFVSPDIPASPSDSLPAAPVLSTLVFPDSPTIVSADIPAAPLVNLPAVPTFEALALPAVPSIDLPSFVSALPGDDLVAPTAEFQYAEAVYDSTLLDPLKAKLLDDLTNGGYGIETADEVALFNRARDRAIEVMLSKIEDAGRAMATRGFPLPPGELSIHVDRAYQDMQDEVAGTSRDITLERSKLFVENRRFTIEQVKDVEQILIGFHNSVQERALNVARATVEMSVAIFKALVERYNARLGAYRAEAEAFANRIRGELAKAEIYRTEVEAVNVGSQIQMRQVDLYRAQIEGQKLPIDIYRTQMEAAKVRTDIERAKTDKYRVEVEAVGVQAQVQQRMIDTYLAQLKGIEVSVDIFKVKMDAARIQADIERTKLEAFRATVDAYTARVQGKVAEFGAYRAQIEGETAKVTAFEAQVRAFGGQVAAAKTRSDVQLGRLQSETEQARTKLENYRAQIAGYEANVKRLLDSGRLETDLYRTDADVARVVNDGTIARASMQEKALEAAVQQNIQISNMTIENARVRLLGVVKSLELRTKASEFAAGNFFAQLTALLSSINTLSVKTEAT